MVGKQPQHDMPSTVTSSLQVWEVLAALNAIQAALTYCVLFQANFAMARHAVQCTDRQFPVQTLEPVQLWRGSPARSMGPTVAGTMGLKLLVTKLAQCSSCVPRRSMNSTVRRLTWHRCSPPAVLGKPLQRAAMERRKSASA